MKIAGILYLIGVGLFLFVVLIKAIEEIKVRYFSGFRPEVKMKEEKNGKRKGF